MKRIVNIAGLLLLPVLIWILAIADLKAQYIGSNAPVTLSILHDSANSRVDTARYIADSVAARAYSRARAGDSAQAALLTAKGVMDDTSTAVFNRLILFYARISGDSVIVDSAKFKVPGKIITDSIINPSGLLTIKNGGLVPDSLIIGSNTTSGGVTLPLRVRYNSNAGTYAIAENSTSGTVAAAGFSAKSNSATGFFLTYSSGNSNAQTADKVAVYANTDATALALFTTTAGAPIEFYSGGTAAGNKEGYFNASGLVVNDTANTRILKITGEYSLPPNDTTAGLVVKSNGPGQPWYYAPDEVAAAGAADSAVISGLINDSLDVFRPVVKQLISDSIAAHPGISGQAIPLGQSLNAMKLRNTLDLITLTDMGSIKDSSFTGAGYIGTHGYDYTNYKADTLSFTATSAAATEGVHIVKTLDLTHFEGGDTSVAADYISLGIYISSGSLTNLNTAALSIRPVSANTALTSLPDTCFFYYQITAASLAAGWNFVKIAKSAFSTGAGTPGWEKIKGIVFNNSAGQSGAVTWAVNNLQLVRKDSLNARPNPFWIAGSKNWTETATAALTIHRRDTLEILAMQSGDYLELAAGLTPVDTMTGRTIVSQTDSSMLGIRASGSVVLKGKGGTKFFLICDGTSDSVAYTYAAKDTVTWKLIRNTGGNFVATVHKSNNADSTLTGVYSGSNAASRISLIAADRLLDLPGIRSSIYKLLLGGYYYYQHADSVKVN